MLQFGLVSPPRNTLALIVSLLLSTVASTAEPAPGLAFSFDPPGPLDLGSGEPFLVACLLTEKPDAVPKGITGWSIAVTHDRVHVALEDATLQATSADSRKDDGFAKIELLDDGRRIGFVSSVALSNDGRATLPPVGIFTIARMRYRGVIQLAAQADGWIRFSEELPPSELGPARNSVTSNAAELFPAKSELLVRLRAPEFTLKMSPDRITARPGGEFNADVHLVTSGNRAVSGPSAWSVGVAHDPEFLELVSVTHKGGDLEPFMEEGAFFLTERVANASGNGFLAIAILNLQEVRGLPANGEAVIARARYRVKDDVELGTIARIAFLDQLQGSGVPVDNHIDFIGGSRLPDPHNLFVKVARPKFLRGDANADARVNLSDSIFVLNSLFRGSAGASCKDTADINDDGRVNIADPVFLMKFLFQGSGVPPPAPYPDIGEDPTDDALDCQTPVE